MKLFNRLKNQNGQGMTEYIIIVALIAIAAIAAFTYFGSTVRNQTAAMTEELSGQSGKANMEAAVEAGKKAGSEATTSKSLKDYSSAQE